MPKIRAVKIWGFQAHVDTYYELDPGLNVFTGPTDGGKTAGTIRALRWLAKGEPSGEDFLFTVRDAAGNIVRQADEAGVEVTLDDGVVIKKTRRRGKTKYWVTGYAEPFEKAEVPQAVIEALGIKTSRYGDYEVDLHFAYQLAAPFLLSEPGSAGAKVLGKLAGTEAVDGAIKGTAKDTYAARQDKTAADKEAERAKEQLTAFEGLEDIQAQLEAAEFILAQIDGAMLRRESLKGLDVELWRATQNIEAATADLDRLAVIPALEEDLKEIEKAQQQYDRLLDLNQQLGRATATVDHLSQQLKDYEGIEAADFLLTTAKGQTAAADTLDNLNTEYRKRKQQVNTSSELILRTKDIDVTAAELEKIVQAQQRYLVMSSLRNEYAETLERVAKCDRALEVTIGIDEAAGLLPQIEASQARIAQLTELLNTLNIKESTRQQAEAYGRKAQEELDAAERELTEAWDAAGDKCPLCEQQLIHVH